MTCKIFSSLIVPEAHKIVIFIPIITESGYLNLNDTVFVFFLELSNEKTKFRSGTGTNLRTRFFKGR